MSSEETIIQVEDVGKCFHIYRQPHDRLKQFIMPILYRASKKAPRNYFESFWALQHVSFEVKRGESIGIIGQNGSGKSTLLQVIMQLLTPTYGKINVKGEIGALIELGSGFNPEFTGRENIYLNASLLGLKREEIEKKFDEIAAFADIGKHLDQVVKTYSSGMMLRLAFAVQMAVAPEVLIIDEALAVGDAKFQLKCFKRLEELKSNGTTILFVSHAVELVKTFCDKGLLLNAGQMIYYGDTKTATTKYYEILFPSTENHYDNKNTPSIAITLENDLKPSWGAGGASLKKMSLQGLEHPNILIRESYISIFLKIYLDFHKINKVALKESLSKNLFTGIRLDNNKGLAVFDVFHKVTSDEMSALEAEKNNEINLEFNIEIPELCQGQYFLTFGIAIGTLSQVLPLYSSDNVITLAVEPHQEILGQIRPKFKSKKVSSWDT